MPRNELKLEELKVRVLKLKETLYNETYESASEEWYDGAHYTLSKVLDILQEYRY